jgi:hypothetical protein
MRAPAIDPYRTRHFAPRATAANEKDNVTLPGSIIWAVRLDADKVLARLENAICTII